MADRLRPTDGRVPPYDMDAEAAVLSAILLEPARLYDVQGFLAEEAFYSDANRMIYRAIVAVERAGTPVDPVSVATWLRAHEQLLQVGGTPYLAQITDAIPAVAHVVTHAETVAALAKQRHVVAVAQTIAAEGYGPQEDVRVWTQSAEARMYAAARWSAEEATDNTMHGVMEAVFDEVRARSRGEGEPAGIPTGFPSLDRRIGGWRPKVYVVAGRPGMGKSAFVAQAARQVADQGYGAVIVSLEPDRNEVGKRLLSSATRIDFRRLEEGDLTDTEWGTVTNHVSALQRLPLAIRKTPRATVAEVRTIVRQEMAALRRAHGESLRLGMIVVDYIQLLDGERQKGETRDGELSRISRDLAWLTGEFSCTVLQAAQLNRAVESRQVKRPVLSDLRESGAIEQDAYAVFFPFRESYYDEARKGDRFQECELIIAKNRNGSAPTVKFAFEAPCMRFAELPERDEGEWGLEERE